MVNFLMKFITKVESLLKSRNKFNLCNSLKTILFEICMNSKISKSRKTMISKVILDILYIHL